MDQVYVSQTKKPRKMVARGFGRSRSGRGHGNKDKKVRAVENANKIEEDRSVLRQPIDIGVRGVKDLMKAVAGGTNEFQDIVMNECSVIYECKMCFSLFRSLANFVSHKRMYCMRRLHCLPDDFTTVQNENQAQTLVESDIVVIPDMPSQNEQNANDAETWVTSDKTCNSESVTVEGLGTLTPRKKLDSLKVTKRQDITEILAHFNQKRQTEVVRTSDDVPDSVFYADMAQRMMRATARPKAIVELESINASSTSVFQTLKTTDSGYPNDSMKVQLIDIDRIVSKNQAIMQENGTFMVTSQTMESEEEKKLEKHYCQICGTSFLTQHTLSGHVQTYHRERLCYPCPLCKVFFASPTGVYRHLSKAHHRTEQQIRRLRPQVLSKARKRLLQSTKDSTEEDENKPSRSEEEEWMNDFEAALRCNGCGKLFNRRAVLNVHSLTCRKMQALLNGSSSHPTNKVKSGPHSKSHAKAALASKSKAAAPPQLPKSGILVRRDYGKCGRTFNKSSSSPSTEVVKRISWNDKSWEQIGRSASSSSRVNCFGKRSTSSGNSTATCTNANRSQKPCTIGRPISSDEDEPTKGHEKRAKKSP